MASHRAVPIHSSAGCFQRRPLAAVSDKAHCRTRLSQSGGDGALPAAAFGKEALARPGELAVVRLQALQFASLAGWHIGAEAC
jgi:hypothetical protein